MKRYVITVIYILFVFQGHACDKEKGLSKPKPYSGIYPQLAYYNNEGECGAGAVVPWAGSLWVITYGPHLPKGSSDKLYEIKPDLQQVVRPESIGGTPANRMIHKESDQLFIGPYAIDRNGHVRVIPYSQMTGRHTGNARHLTDPANKVYYGTMEEGFYEVDVSTLGVTTIYKDGNLLRSKGDMEQYGPLLPGAHGKGLYSGQGVLVYANNGEANHQALEKFDVESGSLCEWNGNEWKLVRRNQFCEVTGPGGIYGNPNPATDPVWATGWDHKSLILGVRDNEKWSFYRLPKASHTYDGAHGWYTEWPRIRDVGIAGNPEYLMTMHGMFWHFPENFNSSNTAGIRPRSAYLKILGDFTRWNGQLVFGCDDAAVSENNNRRKTKGNMAGTGQSNSNLWFTSPSVPDHLGTPTADGAVWLSEQVDAGELSEPFLFAGWDYRSAWIKNDGEQTVSFTFGLDKKGDTRWENCKSVSVRAGESMHLSFDSGFKGEWVRVSADKACKATVHFWYAQKEKRHTVSDPMFKGMSEVSAKGSKAGLLWGLDNNRRALGVLAGVASDKEFTETGYYELDASMKLVKKNDPKTAATIRENLAIPKNVLTLDDASVLIIDDAGRRWRLPKGDSKYTELVSNSLLRICREVVTQRDLFNCAGTFYELPREEADGFAKIRPIASHHFRIFDYASYRGMLIMTGLDEHASLKNPRIIRSDDGKAAVWAGVIDDLWKLGKPVGHGGPWKNTLVKADVPSDPYLIAFYDKRSLELSHQANEPVTFRIEVEPVGHGPWMLYKKITVKPGEKFRYEFPPDVQARWIRFSTNRNCLATAWLDYR
ncbi:MAG: hypothetical protein PHI28_01780 [Mangrovibacterium sp.]|nr:hypothetical protein [Mangrovibacterium sp.]